MFWKLAKASWADFSTWRATVEEAKANGWTLNEVLRVLDLCHPLSVFFFYPILLLVLWTFFAWLLK